MTPTHRLTVFLLATLGAAVLAYMAKADHHEPFGVRSCKAEKRCRVTGDCPPTCALGWGYLLVDDRGAEVCTLKQPLRNYCVLVRCQTTMIDALLAHQHGELADWDAVEKGCPSY